MPSRQCLVAVALLITLFTPMLMGAGIGAQDSGGKAMVDAATSLVKAAFPEIWGLISNATPKVLRAQAGEYGEALSGFPTYIVKWSCGGADVDVLVAVVDSEAVPVGIEATVNGQASEKAGRIVYGAGDKVISEVRALYEELARQALNNGGVEVIGFQIHINGTPVAFIEPTKPSIVPAMLSWNVYFVKPILAFSVFNDYPLVKAAVMRAGGKALKFRVSTEEVKDILSKHGELRNVSRISKYVLIANRTARPAYVITLGPWNTAVVYADNGEFISSEAGSPNTASAVSATTPTTSFKSNSWGLPVPPQYFPYFLSGIAMAVTALIGTVIIRLALKRETR